VSNDYRKPLPDAPRNTEPCGVPDCVFCDDAPSERVLVSTDDPVELPKLTPWQLAAMVAGYVCVMVFVFILFAMLGIGAATMIARCG
jgi:hypothetical protein